MKKIIFAALMATLISAPAQADDNIAACEIVLQQQILEYGAKEDKTAPLIATFVPATDFIFSVFDQEDGHLTQIDDKQIKALMCTRSNVMPTEFDLKLISTGVPFYVSPNFDAPDSALLAIAKKDGIFAYDYVGPDLGKDEMALLKLRLETLNHAED